MGELVTRPLSGWRLASAVAPFAFTVAPSVLAEGARAISRRIDWSNSRLNAAEAEQRRLDDAYEPPRARARISPLSYSAGYRYLRIPRRRIYRRRRTRYYRRRPYY